MDTGNTRREVRSVVFVLARSESAFEGAAELDSVINRIGLVTVGDNLHVGRVAGRVVDNQVRVGELGFVEGLRLHEAGLGFHFENAVTAIHATAHDPVHLHVGLAVGAFAEHNATTRIRVIGEGLEILFCFVCVFHGPKYRKTRSYSTINRILLPGSLSYTSMVASVNGLLAATLKETFVLQMQSACGTEVS